MPACTNAGDVENWELTSEQYDALIPDERRLFHELGSQTQLSGWVWLCLIPILGQLGFVMALGEWLLTEQTKATGKVFARKKKPLLTKINANACKRLATLEGTANARIGEASRLLKEEQDRIAAEKKRAKMEEDALKKEADRAEEEHRMVEEAREKERIRFENERVEKERVAAEELRLRLEHEEQERLERVRAGSEELAQLEQEVRRLKLALAQATISEHDFMRRCEALQSKADAIVQRVLPDGVQLDLPPLLRRVFKDRAPTSEPQSASNTDFREMFLRGEISEQEFRNQGGGQFGGQVGDAECHL